MKNHEVMTNMQVLDAIADSLYSDLIFLLNQRDNVEQLSKGFYCYYPYGEECKGLLMISGSSREACLMQDEWDTTLSSPKMFFTPLEYAAHRMDWKLFLIFYVFGAQPREGFDHPMAWTNFMALQHESASTVFHREIWFSDCSTMESVFFLVHLLHKNQVSADTLPIIKVHLKDVEEAMNKYLKRPLSGNLKTITCDLEELGWSTVKEAWPRRLPPGPLPMVGKLTLSLAATKVIPSFLEAMVEELKQPPTCTDQAKHLSAYAKNNGRSLLFVRKNFDSFMKDLPSFLLCSQILGMAGLVLLALIAAMAGPPLGFLKEWLLHEAERHIHNTMKEPYFIPLYIHWYGVKHILGASAGQG